MFCPKCGKKIADGVSFCPECGARIAAAAQGTTPGSDAQNSQAQAASSAIAKKKRSKKPLAILIVLLVVAAGAFVGWRVLASQGDTVTAEIKREETGSESVAHENFTVGEVRYAADGAPYPRLEVIVTNNTDKTMVNVPFSVEGVYEVTDEYGDIATETSELDLTCWAPGGGDKIAYLEPGDNEVTLIPTWNTWEVATYQPRKGDAQDITLADIDEFTVEVWGGNPIDNDTLILSPEECDLELTLNGDLSVSGSITNNTDDRWRSVTVCTRLLDADGGPSPLTVFNSSGTSNALWSELSVEYVKPGATEELSESLVDYSKTTQIEALYVVVERDV